jgi:hypothetical protein
VYTQNFDPVSDSLALSSIFVHFQMAARGGNAAADLGADHDGPAEGLAGPLAEGLRRIARPAQVGHPHRASALREQSGGVLGKMVSPQNLAIGAAAVVLAGQEGDLFRKVLGWSIALVLMMCVLVYLQSTDVLGWMVVK